MAAPLPLASPGAPYPSVQDARCLVRDLCSAFYSLGWVSGTGGGMSLRAQGGRIVMAPSGVQKERLRAEEMFVLDDTGAVVEAPTPPPSATGADAPPPLKLSECAPLFMAAYELRGAGAVLHSHAMEALLATLLDPAADAFRVSHLEMIKGLAGHGYADELVIPIIENTARECQLTASLRAAMAAHPAAPAVLVRRHGVYVWGATWQAAKTQAECLHYLFQAAVEARRLGMPPLRGPPQPVDAAAAALAAMRLQDGVAGASHQAGPPRYLVLELDEWSLVAAGSGAHDDVAPLLSRAAAAGVRVATAAACVSRATQRALLTRAAPVEAARSVALFCAGDSEMEATAALFDELELALGGAPRDASLVLSASRAAALAAHQAGWRAALVLRDGAEAPTDLPPDVAVVTSLSDVKLPV